MRRFAGIILIICSAALIIIPAVSVKPVKKESYRSGLKLHWTLEPIRLKQGGDVQVNHADAEELMEKLPGVGETISALIINERLKNGPFYYPEDLESVKGIGPRTVLRLSGLIDFTASESEE